VLRVIQIGPIGRLVDSKLKPKINVH